MNAFSLARLHHFLAKPAPEKRETLRYFARRALSRAPYCPVRVRLELPGGPLHFWWSYFVPDFSPGRGLLNYWGSDLGELRFLFSYLEPGAIFFDVGSYHGIYAMVAARRLGGRGEVVAFEPAAGNRRRLKLHLRMNRAERVRVEPCALSSSRSTVALYTPLRRGFRSMNSLRVPSVPVPVGTSRVETITLDEYVERGGFERLDALKVDTEGAEREVFRGAERALEKFRPVILCEVLDRVTAPWGYPAREIVASLARLDYDWYDFCPDGTLLPHTPRREYPELRNYLAAPREKGTRLARRGGSAEERVSP
jgi:FkbM family methyltransferase